ncbi:unnamed protein product [Cuscuta epithymum]|uniref:DUF3615 domain-containing protein n=1 Tax=Cuscuta epithymum TaxID=186058 RepID=A0AAV0DQC3_9ASTE|nr:unnamed protein product [Cuscuta epithymum]
MRRSPVFRPNWIYVWLCWPQTLGGLINIAYNSSSGLSSDSNHNNHSNNSLRSDNGSESFSSHSTVEGEWLEVLTDNGHLHIDRILPLLPPAPPEFPHFYKQCVECAIKALMHYNKKHKGSEYELVAPLISSAIPSNFEKCMYVFHCNFLAKAKTSTPSSSKSLVELFYAELQAVGILEADDEVIYCCIVSPSPSFGSSPASLDMQMIHPPDLQCSYCGMDGESDSD